MTLVIYTISALIGVVCADFVTFADVDPVSRRASSIVGTD